MNENTKPSFRDSLLTQILEPYFSEDNNITMITCLHPGLPYLPETATVLEYSCKAKNISYLSFLDRNYQN